MINKIIDGISIALNAEFGDDYEIYTESIEQGLTEPCFSIVLVDSGMSLFRSPRYLMNNAFCVHYFPKSQDEARQECQDIILRLYDCLEHIEVEGDLIRGTEMTGSVVDGVVNFFVSFDLFVRREVERLPEMESYSVDSGVKG